MCRWSLTSYSRVARQDNQHNGPHQYWIIPLLSGSTVIQQWDQVRESGGLMLYFIMLNVHGSQTRHILEPGRTWCRGTYEYPVPALRPVKTDCCCCVALCPRVSVDILGTSWDQCVSMVRYCFTSTETIKLFRTFTQFLSSECDSARVNSFL